MKLGTGESFVFSLSSFLCVNDEGAAKLGSGVMKMKTRGRKGVDIGRSKMAGATGGPADHVQGEGDGNE